MRIWKGIKAWWQKRSPDYEQHNLAEHEEIVSAIVKLNSSLNFEVQALYALINDKFAAQLKAEKVRASRLNVGEKAQTTDVWDEIARRNGL